MTTGAPGGGQDPARTLHDRLARARDLVLVAALALPATLVGLVVAGVVRVRLGRPVLFRQTRAGRGGEPFVLLKFRTMLVSDDAQAHWCDDGPRTTPVGDILRSWSLDELPQLVNIARGDMSFVGPRPLYVEYVARYDAVQARRLQVRPGLTGLAQVRGRNADDWATRLRHDVEYVDRRGPVLDLVILLRTAAVVLRRTGVRQRGSASSSVFDPDAEG